MMRTIKEFFFTDGRWRITYRDNVVVEIDYFPFNFEYIGSSITLAPLDKSPNEQCYESWWNFENGLCPFRINGKWGFVDSNLTVVINPVFDFVGEIHSRKTSCWRPEEFIHNIDWNEGKCRVIFKSEQKMINLDGSFVSEYESHIRQVENLTIKDIIRVSKLALPKEYQECPWMYPGLNHGKAILETEEQCCAYMAAYGDMHKHKLYRALDEIESKFPYNLISKGVEIYDWGCGQGIGAIAVIEKLRHSRLLDKLHKVTLEEPSTIARNRAVLHVKQALHNSNVEIIDTPLYLPSDIMDNDHSITEIDVKQPCAIHIFSNILDIDAVSLKRVSKLITSSGTHHIALCIGPANLNESRINSFKNYFVEKNVNVFTDYRNTNFGHHPNGRAYGCLIKSFSYNLSSTLKVLHEYKYFAPIQLFASYSDGRIKGTIEQCAFEVLAPFDMTAHKNLCPIYALISNLISRGCPTIASKKILESVLSFNDTQKEKNLNTVARIQKTLIEALISERINLKKDSLKILVLEDNTSIAKIALEDFYELYHNLISITENYDNLDLPTFTIDTRDTANTSTEYDIIIDVSIDQYSNAENVVFSKFKALNDCYFIVRSSKNIYEDRILYTTERIKYKKFVKKDSHGNYINIDNTCEKLRYFLNLIFRKDDFRPGQLPILNRALQLKSVIGLLPTGGGKSLTYQLAAMLQPGVTLVVDPLKGLMKDQYDGLLKTGIDCISFINGDIVGEERTKRELALTGSQTQIMFLSPERLSIHRFREVLRSMRESNVYFAYGVIDEVHCISEWGHDFRLAYLHLGRNLYNYVLPKDVEGTDNHISLFGLTATASFDVLADVERELSGNNSYSLEDDATIRYENTNRLELQYYIYPVDASEATKARMVDGLKEDMVINAIKDATEKIQEIQNDVSISEIKKRFLERENISDKSKIIEVKSTDLYTDIDNEWYAIKNTNVAGIVFCIRANKEEKPDVKLSVPTVANTLRDYNINRISTYKGGDDTSCQDDFLTGKTNLMVATKAFGMGIDKSNVRLTVHLNYPSSLESFVQEAGRAGRDRKMALATIMYSPKKFWVKNVKTDKWQDFSADYTNNKFFYDMNFLGEEFELFVMELLMNNLNVNISNEEFKGVETQKIVKTKGIIQFIDKYEEGRILTYYISYEEKDSVLDSYNEYLYKENMPVFLTPKAKLLKNSKGFNFIKDYGFAIYKDAIQKAIYRMCIIGLIDDFTEDYANKTFRITTICQDELHYYDYLRLYYRKYYSEDRVEIMINEVKQMATNDGTIMACLKHLTSFIYRSIADKRARGVLDMEQFCNMAITSEKDWKEINEELKDFIYYYFNSKYAREGFITYDSSINDEIPYSLKDDTNFDIHSENEITDFGLVRKYMRVVDPEIVNNDSQMDNIKHLQGAVRLIRRAILGMNPVLNLLNVFCILYLKQHTNEMLEEELYNDYKEVLNYYSALGNLALLNEYTELLIKHSAIIDKEYINKLQTAIQLEQHMIELKNIINKYTIR